ncbi:MAG: hypothetical protein ABIH50_00770 [bacterium]
MKKTILSSLLLALILGGSVALAAVKEPVLAKCQAGNCPVKLCQTCDKTKCDPAKKCRDCGCPKNCHKSKTHCVK